MSEPKYDDREITFTENRTEMLSELTERERQIFFAGVGQGFSDGSGITLMLICIFAIIAMITYLIFKATH